MTSTPDAFVPLAVSSTPKGNREEFRVLVAPSPEKARPLREVNSALGNPAAEHLQRTNCEPRVTIQREGDCITSIQVHCSCGQIIDLKCAYAEASTSAGPVAPV